MYELTRDQIIALSAIMVGHDHAATLQIEPFDNGRDVGVVTRDWDPDRDTWADHLRIVEDDGRVHDLGLDGAQLPREVAR